MSKQRIDTIEHTKNAELTQRIAEHRDQVLEEVVQLCAAKAANAKRQAWKLSNKNDPTTHAIWKSRAAVWREAAQEIRAMKGTK